MKLNGISVSDVDDTAADIMTIALRSIKSCLSAPEIIFIKNLNLAGGWETKTVGPMGFVLKEMGGTKVEQFGYVVSS